MYSLRREPFNLFNARLSPSLSLRDPELNGKSRAETMIYASDSFYKQRLFTLRNVREASHQPDARQLIKTPEINNLINKSRGKRGSLSHPEILGYIADTPEESKRPARPPHSFA